MTRVLIVEDEIVIARGLSLMIRQSHPDFQILGIARNGKEGLRQALEGKPHLIFTDINMPTMNGLEMIARIQEMGLSPQFVILSGYAEFEYARSAMQMGVTDYLLKPITPETLEDILKPERRSYGAQIRTRQAQYLEQLKDPPPESLAQQVRDWLDQNFTVPISYQMLRDVFGHSEKYLASLFKEKYGISPNKYLRDLRLNMAKKLLQSNPNILLKDVAEMVGFTDVFYFSRTFKAQEGISPSQYAQRYADSSCTPP